MEKLLISIPLQITLTLLLLTASQSIAKPAEVIISEPLIRKEFSLKMELPEGFELTAQEGPDFSLYEIHKGEAVYLVIYSGGHPDFPHTKAEGTEVSSMDICIDDGELDSRSHGHPIGPMRIVSEWKDGKLIRRQLLARYTLGGGYPSYIHAFTISGLTETELQVAERILFSLKLKPKEPGTKPPKTLPSDKHQ